MSIERFWNNVRGAGAAAFPFDVLSADGPLPTAEEVDRRLRADTRWFRRLAVAGYDAEAFRGFLAPEEMAELDGGVAAFQAALAANDVGAGVAAFARILSVLNFYLYADPDGLRFGKRIESRLRQAGWPDTLRELRFWDATRDDDFLMLSIYATLRESKLKTIARYLEECRWLRPLLDELAREVVPDWFPHITFRTDETLAEYAEQPDEDDFPPVAVPPAALPGVA